MAQNTWVKVLDTLYQMGGYGEHPSKDTDGPLNPEVNLVEQTGLSNDDVNEASKKLQEMGFCKSSTTGHTEDEQITRYVLELTGEGYKFGHDRKLEQTHAGSNKSIALLTLVLAFVGMAQALALSARVSQYIDGVMVTVMTVSAAVVLIVIYFHLYFSGDFPLNSD